MDVQHDLQRCVLFLAYKTLRVNMEWFRKSQILDSTFIPRKQVFPNLGDVPAVYSECAGVKECNWNYSVLTEAAARGYLKIIRRIHLDIGLNPDSDIILKNSYVLQTAALEASFFGRLNVVRYFLRRKICKWNASIVIAAISGGSLDIFKFAMESKKYTLPGPGKVYEAIGKKGDVRFLEYLWANYPCGNIKERYAEKELVTKNKEGRITSKKRCVIGMVYSTAIKNGHLEMVKWLVNKKIQFSTYGVQPCMSKSSLEMLKYLHEECKIKLSSMAFDFPAASGNIKIINYLLSKKCKKSSDACQCAAFNDQLETLQHLRANDFEWGRRIHYHRVPKRIKEWILTLKFEDQPPPVADNEADEDGESDGEDEFSSDEE